MSNSWLGLENKSVIVTGGASGIGYATVQEFLDDGARVAVCDMNPNTPEFKAKEGQYIYIRTDITKKNEVDSMVKQVVDAFGTVDVLVNNAGINIPRLLVDEGNQYELDEAVWDKVMNVNVKGLFLCSQAAAKVMVKNGKGVIINMSSECGLEGSEGQSVYATALSYTRGITVEQLRAGYSKTNTTPLGRSGKLTEVANTVAFLASDRAGYIHGTTINIAGGKTRG